MDRGAQTRGCLGLPPGDPVKAELDIAASGGCRHFPPTVAGERATKLVAVTGWKRKHTPLVALFFVVLHRLAGKCGPTCREDARLARENGRKVSQEN